MMGWKIKRRAIVGMTGTVALTLNGGVAILKAEPRKSSREQSLLVGATDDPYPEMVDAARAIHSRLYPLRANAGK